MRRDLPLISFNRGIISPLALARIDLKAAMMAAETQTNWMPRAFGSMMLRPGTEYIDTFTNMESDDNIFLVPFVYDNGDTAIIEVFDTTSGGNMRIRVDDSLISYPSVSSSITNGEFANDVSGWTDDDDAGAVSAYGFSQGEGRMYMVSNNGFAYARRYQEITVSGGDINTEHAINVEVSAGEVTFSIGSTQGDDDYVVRTILTKGNHILSFTPSGNFFIDLICNTKYQTLIASVSLVSGSNLFNIGFESSIPDIKYRQSADVVYFSIGNDYTPSSSIQYRLDSETRLFKIMRYGARSYGLVEYEVNDGPFLPYNRTGITLSASATTGSVTLIASDSLFNEKHEGSIFAIDSVGQEVSNSITAAGQWTNDIRVFGLNRSFTIELSGTWVATVTLQRSIGVSGTWVDVTTYTGNTTTTYDDGLDNQVIYYRIGVDTGDYTSGTVSASLEYSDGSIQGVARIEGVSSGIGAQGLIVKELGGTAATTNWREGRWSHFRGFPNAVAIHDSRLCWAGKQNIDCSEVDDYQSFDDTIEGAAKPISRSIGYGPMDHINWLISMKRLFMGTAASEIQARASDFNEPLTETDFSLTDVSTQGSADISPVKVDNTLVYVSKTLHRIYKLYYDVDFKDYTSNDLTALNPELLNANVVKMVVQRQPDTRIHVLLADGTVALLMHDETDNIAAWIKLTTTGTILDMVVLPGTEEDRVYYAVSRTNGVYLEKFALESECQGGDLNKQADSFVVYDSTSTTTPFTTELLHLANQTVVIWADGNYVGTDTVTAGGALTSALATAASKVVVGLSYTAQFKSVKLAFGSATGTTLTKRKKIDQIGLVLRNTHCQGIEFGDDFTNMSMIPSADRPDATDDDHIFTEYDADMTRLDAKWSTDSRLCLQATAPRPCTVLGAIVGVDYGS